MFVTTDVSSIATILTYVELHFNQYANKLRWCVFSCIRCELDAKIILSPLT